MTLAISGENDDEESKHCVTAVPALGLDGSSPAALGERPEVVLVVFHCLYEDGKNIFHCNACFSRRGATGHTSAKHSRGADGLAQKGWSEGHGGRNESHFGVVWLMEKRGDGRRNTGRGRREEEEVPAVCWEEVIIG